MEEFIPPPEAPVFQPSLEEFQDPISYITKIRPVVVNTGICKIRPPSGWKPPFAVDIEAFRFTPRIQPLNELEAKTRVKLNFLEKLAKFWELQGIVFKIPNVDRYPLDLHKLFKVVVHCGGFSEVSRLRKWTTVAKEMGYSMVSVASSLRVNYERYLYPYEIFLVKKGQLEVTQSPSKSTSTTSTPNATPVKCKYGLRQNKRRDSNWEDPDYAVEMDLDNPEFKKLAFTAPGPKNSFAPLQRSDYGDTGKKRDEGCDSTLSDWSPSTTAVKSEGDASTEQYNVLPSQHPLATQTTAQSTASAVTTDSPPPPCVPADDQATPSSESKARPFHQQSPPPSTSATPGEVKKEEAEGVTRKLFGEGVSIEVEPKLMSEGEHLLQCGVKKGGRPEAVDDVKCTVCKSGDCEDELLICDTCEIGYHTFCLDSPLPSIPPGSWSCPNCVAHECIKPSETFGFEQAKQQYSLSSFQLKANQFKQEYFKKSARQVPCSDVEREFWRLVSSIEDDVVVEYGADLLTSTVGSGFPKEEHASSPEDHKYALSGWNLNNLPSIKGSVLSYVDADISGMKVPWAYVGMCFSCFCWHIEDHWSYSINYLHWGEPKTWYGVPSAYAESLEATMKDQAPELFENQPDLLHHLVTTLSPNILMKQGIPVVRTDQRAGEFVVTFPRAYHAGFNQGFNFAEAVNFSLADWIPVGRESINHYRSMCRSPVFSHDELVCKMMAQPSRLELCLLLITGQDSARMVQLEETVRAAMETKGVTQQQREYFELSKDEERQCRVCKTYCFLSAVRCPCTPNHLVCPHHLDDLCTCPMGKKVLRYRYTLTELSHMLQALQTRSQAYQGWLKQVEALLDGEHVGDKPAVVSLRALLSEAQAKGYGGSEPCEELKATIQEAEKCSRMALQISGKHRTRGGGVTPAATRSSASTEKKMDVNELVKFLEQVDLLPCKIPEAGILLEQLSEVQSFQQEASHALSIPHSSALSAQLQELVKRGEAMEVDVPEMGRLRTALSQLHWVSESEAKLNGKGLTLDILNNLLRQGTNLSQESLGDNGAMDSILMKIRTVLTSAQQWEQLSKDAILHKPCHPMEYFTDLLTQAQNIPVLLPSVATITDTLDSAHQWTRQAQALQDSDNHPHYDVLKTMLASGRPIPVKLGLLAQLESRFAAAKGWVDRAVRTFMKKNSNLSILEVLLPRNRAHFLLRHVNNKAKRRTDTGELSVSPNPLSELNGERLKEMDKIHEMEESELKFAAALREENIRKMEQDEDVKNGNLHAASPALYCFCRKPEAGYMLQCELCHEWYHATCLHIPKGKRMPGKDIGKESRFLCLSCQRTRRPRLDAIVSLLISLQKVPVTISEGTALHCLAERAISWQKRAKSSLQNSSVILEAAKGQMRRTEELKNHIKRWRQEASTTIGSTTTSIQAQLANSAGSVLHHYETELTRLRSEYSGLSATKRKELEDLLMEGDLLEVSLDEVQQLWAVLHQDTETLTAFERSGAEEGEGERGGKEEEGRRRRKRKGGGATGSGGSCDGPSGRGKVPPSSKRQKRTTRSTTPKSSPSPVPSNSSSSHSMPVNTSINEEGVVSTMQTTPTSGTSSSSLLSSARQTPLQYLPKLRKIPQPASPVSTTSHGSQTSGGGLLSCNEEIVADEAEKESGSEEEREEEAECSAPHCKKPIGDQISWVQCDRCQDWFHCICVGLTKEYAEKIDKYICKKCLALVGTGGSGVSGGVSGGRAKVRMVHQVKKPSPLPGNSVPTSKSSLLNVLPVSKPPSAQSSNPPPANPRVFPTTTQELVKGLLQNPQLAAQLLSNMPLK